MLVFSLKIQIDNRESKNRIKSANNYYTKQGHEVTVEKLPIGDYIFNDVVCFEYKTMQDFIQSIMDGRVFNQAINQSENFKYHFVIVDGDLKTRVEYINKLKWRNHITFNLNQYYGAIARLNTVTTVLHSLGGKQEAFRLMEKCSEKCLDDTPVVKKFNGKMRHSSAFNFLVYCVHDCKVHRAKRICDELGLSSLEDLLNITRDDLLKVNGIGEVMADKIMKDLH